MSRNTSTSAGVMRSVLCTRRAGLVLTLSLASGLFIWAKLRMVAAVPRTAYAEPAAVEGADGDTKAGKVREGGVRTAHVEDGAGEGTGQP